MQIGGKISFFKLKARNKKNLFSNYTFVFFVILSITLIVLDKKKSINSSLIRSNIIDTIFFTKKFILSSLPNMDKFKLSFKSKNNLLLENKLLKEKIEQNNLYKLKSEKLEIENNILKKELSLMPPSKEDYVLVKVIADTQTDYKKTIIVNAGKNNNINKGDTALTSKGLIGSVIEVYDNHSRVLLLNDINSKIPVRVGKKNKKAIISGNNSNKIDLLYLKENISFDEDEVVYTSGDGGFFSPGIPIGQIKKENNYFFVRPFNDSNKSQYINIFINQFKNF